MKIAEFITKNQTLILAAGGILLGAYLFNRYAPSKSSTLVEGLKNPIDALLANIGIMPAPKGSGLQLTPSFQQYIDAYGGIDKYLSDHKNGTFKAPAFNGATGSW